MTKVDVKFMATRKQDKKRVCNGTIASKKKLNKSQ